MEMDETRRSYGLKVDGLVGRKWTVLWGKSGLNSKILTVWTLHFWMDRQRSRYHPL